MMIYIPSYKRADRIKTVSCIDDYWLERTRVVVYEEEVELYQDKLGKDIIIPCPIKVKGISNKRQWVIENAEDDFILFLDDDLEFDERTPDGKLKRTKDTGSMFFLLQQWLEEDEIRHVGVSARLGNNRVQEDFVEIARMTNAYGYHVPTVLDSGVRFDSVRVMEDFHMTLGLLEKGFKNRVTFQYAYHQTKSGDVGGCSVYRDFNLQKSAARALEKLHPGVVKVLIKTSKDLWEGMDSLHRVDVNVQWKKAYHPFARPSSGISQYFK
jgi:hypothetical protein